ncbi:XRE family transcriptional regulator [Gordonia sp. TBRC 11910]|uniref:XRE family transcriptional regulator n=1 Tax=Gordonia asplenii TaxID=2725283 RepID=A0A848KVR4_9ACTN|nr:helix-turn-helix transcriptional regulator [Gordonia asplenii]NMO02352.1 XRE family transcriptional regulator [Gordonia asplenii]
MMTVDEFFDVHPVNEQNVAALKAKMMAEVRGCQLRELREAANVTQVELAALLRVSQNRISRIEKGDIERSQVDTLRRYVEALGGRLKVEVELGGSTVQIA